MVAGAGVAAGVAETSTSTSTTISIATQTSRVAIEPTFRAGIEPRVETSGHTILRIEAERRMEIATLRIVLVVRHVATLCRTANERRREILAAREETSVAKEAIAAALVIAAE